MVLVFIVKYPKWNKFSTLVQPRNANVVRKFSTSFDKTQSVSGFFQSGKRGFFNYSWKYILLGKKQKQPLWFHEEPKQLGQTDGWTTFGLGWIICTILTGVYVSISYLKSKFFTIGF